MSGWQIASCKCLEAVFTWTERIVLIKGSDGKGMLTKDERR